MLAQFTDGNYLMVDGEGDSDPDISKGCFDADGVVVVLLSARCRFYMLQDVRKNIIMDKINPL